MTNDQKMIKDYLENTYNIELPALQSDEFYFIEDQDDLNITEESIHCIFCEVSGVENEPIINTPRVTIYIVNLDKVDGYFK